MELSDFPATIPWISDSGITVIDDLKLCYLERPVLSIPECPDFRPGLIG